MACSLHHASPANIYWERDIVDGEDLYRRLQDTEVIMRQPQGLPLRLLIIDSIAHLFRDIGEHTDASAYVRRTGMLFRLSALLRRFADTYDLTVVVTNQVHHSSLTHAMPPAPFILLLLMLLLHCITCLLNCICKQTIPIVNVLPLGACTECMKVCALHRFQMLSQMLTSRPDKRLQPVSTQEASGYCPVAESLSQLLAWHGQTVSMPVYSYPGQKSPLQVATGKILVTSQGVALHRPACL